MDVVGVEEGDMEIGKGEKLAELEHAVHVALSCTRKDQHVGTTTTIHLQLLFLLLLSCDISEPLGLATTIVRHTFSFFFLFFFLRGLFFLLSNPFAVIEFSTLVFF